ncbi:MAG: PLP-dependent aminotransferase family protein [Desulfobacterales bacterium]|nr:MAG: PLP-dependent aminotransferase family protein [Desulfobacterales bacterium]
MNTIQTTQLNIPPGVVDLGVGHPSPSLLPRAAMRTAAEHRLSQNDASLLAYGNEQGDGYFRAALAQFLGGHYGTPVGPDDLLITAGASQGLDLVCTLFAQPGDTVWVEEPTYFLALRIFADHGLNIIGLPMDAEGLMVETLEDRLVQLKPSFLYTIPAFHNPSSTTLAASRRKRLVDLSQKYNFFIVADEVYHLLNYTAAPPPPMAGYAEAGTILSLGSFSKILAPGLRLGWIQAQRTLLGRIAQCGLLDSGGGLNPFTSGLVRSVIELGLQQDHLEHLKAAYGARRQALGEALRRHLPPAITFAEPGGGFFFWLKFPDGVDTQALLSEARRQNVGFLPGAKFSSRQGLQNYARLSFSYYETAELEIGVRRLRHVFRDLR